MTDTALTTTPPARTEELEKAEKQLLAEQESVVAQGLSTFAEVGRALALINQNRLYREGYASFESYLAERWGISRSHGYRQIEAAEVVEVVSPNGDTKPASEGVARELVPLKDEPEAARKAWKESIDRFGPRPTAAQVRQVVRKDYPKPSAHNAPNALEVFGSSVGAPLQRAEVALVKFMKQREGKTTTKRIAEKAADYEKLVEAVRKRLHDIAISGPRA